MNVERLRAPPDLVSAKHIAQLKEEFKYAPHTDQVYHRLLSNITVTECLFVCLFQRISLNTGRGEYEIPPPPHYILSKRKYQETKINIKKNSKAKFEGKKLHML